MRRAAMVLLCILTLWSCEEEIPEVSFRIKTEGFILEEAFPDTEDLFPSFAHKVSGGTVTFFTNNNSYRFYTGTVSIEDYEFRLPEGTYQLKFSIPKASLYGQEGGSFTSSPGDVNIETQTTTITVHVEASCSMFLVKDEFNQLDRGIFMIEKHSYAQGYFKSYPLYTDSLSGLYYTYFTPDTVPSNPSAYLWFYGGNPGMEEGALETKDFKIGYQYNIRILD